MYAPIFSTARNPFSDIINENISETVVEEAAKKTKTIWDFGPAFAVGLTLGASVVGAFVVNKTYQAFQENARLEREQEKMERLLQMSMDSNKQLKMKNQLLKSHLAQQTERIDALENKLYYQDKLCYLCEERDVDTSLEPCGHGMCSSCAQRVFACPKCGTTIQKLHARF